MLGLIFIYVSERGPWWVKYNIHWVQQINFLILLPVWRIHAGIPPGRGQLARNKTPGYYVFNYHQSNSPQITPASCECTQSCDLQSSWLQSLIQLSFPLQHSDLIPWNLCNIAVTSLMRHGVSDQQFTCLSTVAIEHSSLKRLIPNTPLLHIW